LNSISPYTALQLGSLSSGMTGMGGRSSAGMDLHQGKEQQGRHI
jgi:hypothetical protein